MRLYIERWLKTPMQNKKGSTVVGDSPRLFERNILATGLSVPVVPQGDEDFRLHASTEHTQSNINRLLGAL
jgi:7-keto-8-aminopelargonate synthetase-like enzyme